MMTVRNEIKAQKGQQTSRKKNEPEVQAVGLDNLEEYLRRKLAGYD